MRTTTAVLLAAGRGTRLGRDKPTLDLGGESLLQRHLRQARLAAVDSFTVVAGAHNHQRIREIVARDPAPDQITVVLQEGRDAHAAAATGLRRAAGADAAFVCGITDVVPDDTYAAIAAAAGEGPALTIASYVLERSFVGGMLDFHPGSHRLRRIVERPEGGCPPGRLVNIWIHHLAGAALITALARATRILGNYEDAINNALAAGLPGFAHHVTDWEAIKDKASLDRARARFLTDDATPVT